MTELRNFLQEVNKSDSFIQTQDSNDDKGITRKEQVNTKTNIEINKYNKYHG